LIYVPIALVLIFGVRYYLESFRDYKISTFPQSTEDRKFWHDRDWLDLALEALNVALIMFITGAVSWIGALGVMIFIAFFKVVVFNPSHAKRQKIKNFFYLSDAGFEGKMKRSIGEKVYYVISVVLSVVGLLLLFV